MHVTHLQWCDFVVWSPLYQPFVQRITPADFMKSAIAKAGKLYFEQFLPAVVPYMIVPPPSRSSASSSVRPAKATELIGCRTQISSTLPPKKPLSSILYGKAADSGTQLPGKTPSSFNLPLHSGKETLTLTASDDVQIVMTNKVNLLSLDHVL